MRGEGCGAGGGCGMKRIAMRVLGLLLIGAVVNVGVAWACALWSPVTRYRAQDLYWLLRGDRAVPSELMHRIPSEWAIQGSPQTYDISASVEHSRGIGLRTRWVSVDEMVPAVDKLMSDHELLLLDAGWPMASLAASNPILRANLSTSALQTPTAWRDIRWGLPAPDWLRPNPTVVRQNNAVGRVLPIQPLPIGFAANVLVFALTLPGLSEGSRWCQRRLRAARGLCPHCSYPIGASPVCTECGKPIPARALRSGVAVPPESGGTERSA